MKLPIDPDSVKGFMPPDEGAELYRIASQRAPYGACLEVGSYCGKSALYMGAACKAAEGVLFTVDHHRGSEENQPGWEHHDSETWDDNVGAMETLPFLRETLHRAGLEGTVIPVVGFSRIVASHWRTPLSLLFIDGGHGEAPALDDYRAWTPHVLTGGYLAIHDVFEDPADGGRPPYEIYRRAKASDLYEDVSRVGSLRVLQKL